MSEEKKKPEEQSEENQGFWAKNILSIFLILFLIVSGIYAFNRDANTDTEDKSVEEKVEEIKQSEENTSDQENTTESKEGDEMKAEKDESTDTIEVYIQKTDSTITVKAQEGDGVTHLARKAVAEYIRDKTISLSKEQKLYAETVLKNQYYQAHLNIGQEVSFDLDTVSDTIQNAQNLTERQIHAWSKYTASVPSL